jgi:hypothetical protein
MNIFRGINNTYLTKKGSLVYVAPTCVGFGEGSSHLKGSPVHVASVCVGSREGADHISNTFLTKKEYKRKFMCSSVD